MSKSKAIIVPDLAFTTHKGRRGGTSSGYKELKAQLKYYQFRDDRNGHIPQEEGLERWVDRGLGQHYREILKCCSDLASNRLLAWTWVVSPAPDLMSLVPEAQRQEVVTTLTEEIVEAYYAARDVETPEYAYVLHDRWTNPTDASPPQQQLHTHVILPATVPTVEGTRSAFDNRANKGHFQLLQAISAEKLEIALDEYVGPEWRTLRPEPVQEPEPISEPSIQDDTPSLSELERWFGNRSDPEI
jgi:hypothetical protein